MKETNQSRLTFRTMNQFDLPNVMEIENNSYEFPWSETIFSDCIRVGYECWLAYYNEDLVAYCILSVAAGESHVLNLCVAKPNQGKGIGRSFIEHLFGIAARRGVSMMLLEVRPSNTRAINCYNATGFNEIGRRPNYYPSAQGREDALLFAREISPNFDKPE